MTKKEPRNVHIPADWRDRYLSVDQAAVILNESPKTLYNRNSRGDGPIFYRIGGRCKYYGKELEAYIRSNGGAVTS
jgi:hypothetical protein